MRVSLDWLSEWVDLPDSLEELQERLTFAGLEIESVERTGPDLSSFVVGAVEARESHPQADRLSVCQVDLGDGALHQIVCGAPNVAVGLRVAVIQPGSKLPDGTRIKKAKLRGVESHGMICSAREIGLGDEHEGILVLDPGARPGAPLSGVLPAGDTVLDVEITPNRGDWASMLGMAREVRTHFPGRLEEPASEVNERGAKAVESISVAIDDPDGCYHYAARVVRGVRIGPSPEWLVRKLEAAGLRSIDVVVDVTNLVLLEFGQPLHAFDLERIRGAQIRVRRAASGERIVTLDGVERELESGDLIIADAERAVAIAGVMGGAESEVSPQTRDVLLESAHFCAGRVRALTRRTGLHSEASYRFERGVDPMGIQRAVDRAARLLAELAEGEVAAGVVEAHGVPAPKAPPIAFDPALPSRVLGVELSPSQVEDLLARVEVACERPGEGAGPWTCRAPSYRGDLAIAEDLVEEVARVWGYDRIPVTLPRQPLRSVALPERYQLARDVRDGLRAAGLVEAIGFPGGPASDRDALRLDEGDPRRRAVAVLNPFSESDAVLRTSALPGLLRMAQRNLARQVEWVRLFEVGSVFWQGAGELPEEPLSVGAVLAGAPPAGVWDPASAPLFFRAKGVLERLAAELDLPLGLGRQCRVGAVHPGAAAEVSLGRERVGYVGELHPEVASHFEIEAPCVVFELNLAPLLPRRAEPARVRDVSRYPLVRRDVAVLVSHDCAAGEVAEAIRKAGGELLTDVHVFDRYEGKGVPEGKLSLAYRMVFQHAERTLREEEISRATERVRRMLEKRFGGELR